MESNHRIELNFYCKTHNQLCCGACLSKIKNEGTGQHFDCNVCPIGEIKNEKKNILDKNIELLEELLGTIENSINELKKINETINEKKEELKLNISKIFTKIRNTINDREDEILLEVDKIFDETYFREEFIKNSEKLPSEIKLSLEKGNNIKKEWDNNEIKLNSKINDCISIENTIKNIYKLKNVIGKSKKVKIQFLPDDEGINKFLEEIIKFGGLDIFGKDTLIFGFKKGKNYEISEEGLVATKTGNGQEFNCTIIGDIEIPKNKICKWKIKINSDIKNALLIGIGPDNPNNEIDFYQKCWSFNCSNSKLVLLSGNYTLYGKNSKKLKKGDIVEVIVDRKEGNLSFAVNDSDYGIAYSNMPKEETLYPIVIILDQNNIVEIV